MLTISVFHLDEYCEVEDKRFLLTESELDISQLRTKVGCIGNTSDFCSKSAKCGSASASHCFLSFEALGRG